MCRQAPWPSAGPVRSQRRGARARFVRNSRPAPDGRRSNSQPPPATRTTLSMCGIIGIIGKAPVTPLLVDALKRLEYRGYDSAGVATLVNGHIDRRRAEGKLVNLET